jgi:hypothetical protein
MKLLDDFIFKVFDVICIVGGFVIISAIVIPIPILLYKVIKNIIIIILDAINGKLSKNNDGTSNYPESQERYKIFKSLLLICLVSVFFITPALILILFFGPIAVLCFILSIPVIIICRIIWEHFKKS